MATLSECNISCGIGQLYGLDDNNFKNKYPEEDFYYDGDDDVYSVPEVVRAAQLCNYGTVQFSDQNAFGNGEKWFRQFKKHGYPALKVRLGVNPNTGHRITLYTVRLNKRFKLRAT
jgi:hypothetical protein